MASIRVEVTAEHIAACDALRLNDLSRPVSDALAEVTGQYVDVSGSEPYGTFLATIGDGEWTLVVDLPAQANAWLTGRWDHEPGSSEPIAFDLEIPDWLVDLVRLGETL